MQTIHHLLLLCLACLGLWFFIYEVFIVNSSVIEQLKETSVYHPFVLYEPIAM